MWCVDECCIFNMSLLWMFDAVIAVCCCIVFMNILSAEMKNAEGTSDKDLSELEQYWKAVRDNPSDFTGWTYLLQYVEQEVRFKHELNMAQLYTLFFSQLIVYIFIENYARFFFIRFSDWMC